MWTKKIGNCQCFSGWWKWTNILKSSKNSTADKDMIISKFTKFIRNSMFKKVKILDGDFLLQKQEASVQNS